MHPKVPDTHKKNAGASSSSDVKAKYRMFETRFFHHLPLKTNAPEAATRVFDIGGVLLKSDPFVPCLNRKGLKFEKM
jgi:hypothetical protein